MKKAIFIFTFTLVTIIKFNCIGQCGTPITLSLNITPESCLGCCNGNIQVLPSGGCPPYMINFSPATSTNSFCSGSYTVTVIDFGCCPAVTQTASVGTPTGIFENGSDMKISIYPQPVHDMLNLRGTIKDIENSEIEIVNILGEIVLKLPYSGTIDASKLSIGFYYLKVTNQQNCLHTSKFIKE